MNEVVDTMVDDVPTPTLRAPGQDHLPDVKVDLLATQTHAKVTISIGLRAGPRHQQNIGASTETTHAQPLPTHHIGAGVARQQKIVYLGARDLPCAGVPTTMGAALLAEGAQRLHKAITSRRAKHLARKRLSGRESWPLCNQMPRSLTQIGRRDWQLWQNERGQSGRRKMPQG